tara:strand:- start:43 stop:630 length:588 start_codon:yes stop_codon:yes gene_type:complete
MGRKIGYTKRRKNKVSKRRNTKRKNKVSKRRNRKLKGGALRATLNSMKPRKSKSLPDLNNKIRGRMLDNLKNSDPYDKLKQNINTFRWKTAERKTAMDEMETAEEKEKIELIERNIDWLSKNHILKMNWRETHIDHHVLINFIIKGSTKQLIELSSAINGISMEVCDKVIFNISNILELHDRGAGSLEGGKPRRR